MNSISVIGSGRAGITVGIGFEQLGNYVIFHDIDERRVEHLEKEGYKVTLDLEQAVSSSSVSFVCVRTPSKGYLDLT